jgi:hypothetical protein
MEKIRQKGVCDEMSKVRATGVEREGRRMTENSRLDQVKSREEKIFVGFADGFDREETKKEKKQRKERKGTRKKRKERNETEERKKIERQKQTERDRPMQRLQKVCWV